ncbi:MAG: ABC transporter ATP-binding protein [Kiloniellales bacterium]
MAVVELEHITKRFGSGPVAVDDISLTIADGEFMVLLGPSGCGKSTTLRMIAGLESITEGTLRIDGKAMNRVPAKDRDIAMVFQSYALYPHMTVRNNLAFGLRRRGFPAAETRARVTRVAETLGLTELLERKPAALSGGQRQRVALGRAIVRDPKVFLFDEPLSNLDAALRTHTRSELIRQYQRLQATMIYVTHDQVEAMTMGTRICVMRDGRIVQIGAPLEVYENPSDTFVASFIGSPPTNLMSAHGIGGADGAVRLQIFGRDLELPRHRASSLPQGDSGAVVFGIRPEDLYLAHPDAGSSRFAAVRARVESVEPLGAETILVLSCEGCDKDITARVSRFAPVRPDDVIDLYLDLGACHLFDPRTTRALPRAPIV